MAEAKDKNTSMVENQGSKDIAEKEKEKEKEKGEEIYWRIRPYYSADFDSETGVYSVRVELPGVPKDQVKLRVLPDMFDLRATREHTQYLLTEYFPYEMDVDTIEAKYDQGLLLVSGKFKDPMDKAVEIKLA